MSKSLLYHGFGIRGYCYRRFVFKGGAVICQMQQPRESLRCPHCGSADVVRRGGVRRRWRHVPIGFKPVFLEMEIARVHCRDCRKIRQVKVRFADGKHRYTRTFARYALGLLRSMTIQDVSRHLGVGWDVIKDIQRQYLKKHYGRPKLRHLKQIAIDEISTGKGHTYLTVVLNLENGHIVFVGPGKGSSALEPFWKRLKASHANVEAVAVDMSPAYTLAVQDNLPDAVLVYDHFHIIKLFNEKLSDLRRDLYREAADGLQKKVLKGTRWLLLMNPENLNEKRNERQRLQEALKLNEPLAVAYYMKEELREFWSWGDGDLAKAFLDDWILRAEYSGIRMLMKFARTLAQHRRRILAYYKYPITTGRLEGTNNKIKTMKRQAYGYRDQEFFQLKILAIHETKYALVG